MTSSMSGAMGMAGATGRGARANTGIGAPNPNAKSGLKSISGHRTFQQFSPEQMQLFQHLFSQLGPESYLQKLAGGDEETFRQMEAPAERDFSSRLGGIASRFSGGNPFGGPSGGMSSRKSSGFQNGMSQAAMDFQQQLQSQRQGLQRQALGDLMSYSQMLFGQQPYGLREKRAKDTKSGWGGIAGGAGGTLLGALLGGPGGAMGGAKMGYDLGSMF